MKANRHARSDPVGLWEDRRGVSEVVGYMIAFGMSSIILVMSLAAFNMMRDHTGDLVADRSVNEVANRVSFAVDEALQAGAQFPESEFSRSLRLPQLDNHESYTVEMGSENVWVNATDAASSVKDADGNDIDTLGRANVSFIPRAKAVVLCSGGETQIPNGRCSVESGDGELVVKYGRPDEESDRGVYFARNG